MLKEIVLPPINMNDYDGNLVETGLVVMSNDNRVNAFVIPFTTKEAIKSIQVCYTFKNNSSVIIQEALFENNQITIPLVKEVRKHRGVFFLEINVYFKYSQATVLKLSAITKRSDIDDSGEFLFNHYYKLFEEYERELENFKNGLIGGYDDKFAKQLKIMLDDYHKNGFGLSSVKIGDVEE